MNKRKNSFSLLRFLSSFMGFGIVLIVFCLVYVWCKNQEVKIGYRINNLHKDIDATDEMISRIESKIQSLKAPDKILVRIPADLKITSGDRIVHLAKIDKPFSVSKDPVPLTYATKNENEKFISQWFKKKLANTSDSSAKVCYLTKNEKR